LTMCERYLVSMVSSQLFRRDRLSFSQLTEASPDPAAAPVPGLGSSRSSTLIMRRRLCSVAARSSTLLLSRSTICFQSLEKWSPTYCASDSDNMVHMLSVLTSWL